MHVPLHVRILRKEQALVAIIIIIKHTHVAFVALTPLTMLPHIQAELLSSPVRGQEQEQPDVRVRILMKYPRLITQNS